MASAPPNEEYWKRVLAAFECMGYTVLNADGGYSYLLGTGHGGDLIPLAFDTSLIKVRVSDVEDFLRTNNVDVAAFRDCLNRP